MKKNINNVSSSQTNKTILLVISAVVIIIIAILAVKLSEAVNKSIKTNEKVILHSPIS